ncbi:glycosyltransferase family 2 protein, partial [Klebsiella pneumoniae]|nr:glycosyltransferase family 2 protein [Klebsiella pneumoniae]
YNDIDYCLKVRSTGRLVVYNPFAKLHHYEYKSRGAEDTAEKLARYQREVERFTGRWAEIISTGDPYYNPNLTRRYQDFSLRR